MDLDDFIEILNPPFAKMTWHRLLSDDSPRYGIQVIPKENLPEFKRIVKKIEDFSKLPMEVQNEMKTELQRETKPWRRLCSDCLRFFPLASVIRCADCKSKKIRSSKSYRRKVKIKKNMNKFHRRERAKRGFTPTIE